MSTYWNDDERDTGGYRTMIHTTNIIEHETYQSICDVMKEFYKEQSKAGYVSSKIQYGNTIKHHRQNAYVPKFVKEEPKDDDTIDVDNSDTEVNSDIMENMIYKKCLYS